MTAVDRDRYPLVVHHPRALTWLTIQGDLGRARNTTEAYGRARDAYLALSKRS